MSNFLQFELLIIWNKTDSSQEDFEFTRFDFALFRVPSAIFMFMLNTLFQELLFCLTVSCPEEWPYRWWRN